MIDPEGHTVIYPHNSPLGTEQRSESPFTGQRVVIHTTIDIDKTYTKTNSPPSKRDKNQKTIEKFTDTR